MSEFLLELSFAAPDLEKRLATVTRLALRFFEELMSRGVGLAELKTGLDPELVVLAIAGLPGREPERERHFWGPLVSHAFVGGKVGGRPTEELESFLEESGLPLEAIEIVPTEKGRRLALVEIKPGRLISQAITGLADELLEENRALVEPAECFALYNGQPLDLKSARSTSALGRPIKDFEQYRKVAQELGRSLESSADIRRRLGN